MPTIQRPQWSKTKTKRVSLSDLLKVMPGWSENEFKPFREHVQSRSRRYNLDTYTDSESQDPAKWQKFLADCRIAFPALDKFEGQWPLDIYYTRWTYWRSVQLKTLERSGHKNGLAGGPATAQDCPQREESHRDGESRKRKRGVDKDNDEALGSTQSTIDDGNSSDVGNNEGASSASRKRKSFEFTPSPPTASPSTSSISLSMSQQAQSSQVITYPKSRWSSWVLCGFQPEVPPSETVQLRKCLDGHEDLLQILTMLGVVTDYHLRALLRLSSRRRHDFFHSGASKGLFTYFEKIVILDLLDSAVDSKLDASSSMRNAGVAEIGRPSERAESLLCDHRASYPHLMTRMKITDEDEYFETVDLIEHHVPGYLDVSLLIEEQDEEQLKALVRSICEKKPSLRRYEGLWPVYVHIYRFMSARRAGLARTPREHHQTTVTHECPLLRSHPHSRVPTALAALLGDVGMEELGPAFLLLGIHTDEQFTSIVTSPRAKAQFLKEVECGAAPECSAFQRLMMGWVVECV
ncbi:hypothetical protein C8R46DRAFT_1351420 [Mycena filopes]|nr:hypothetical protein C8R46DRAFT_1351420 [Mycena filopes]